MPSSSEKRRQPGAAMGAESGFGLIEALIAAALLAVGLLAVAGLSLSVASQSRLSDYQTGQSFAAQQVLEEVHQDGFADAVSGKDTVTIGGFAYEVTRTVTSPATGVKEVLVQVGGRDMLGPHEVRTRLYSARDLPTP